MIFRLYPPQKSNKLFLFKCIEISNDFLMDDLLGIVSFSLKTLFISEPDLNKMKEQTLNEEKEFEDSSEDKG